MYLDVQDNDNLITDNCAKYTSVGSKKRQRRTHRPH